MINNTIQTLTLLFVGLYASPVFAHIGAHTSAYHPLSGVDHFLLVLLVGLVAMISGYYIYKK